MNYLSKLRPAKIEPGSLAAYRHAVVIPVCNELDYLPLTLQSLQAAAIPGDTAILLVVNHPHDATPEVKQASATLLRQLRSDHFAMPQLFFIDAPDLDNGVGEARKIGMDAVIGSLDPAKLSQSILFSLDADTLVDSRYFSVILDAFASKTDAVALNFRHQTAETADGQAAIDRYERYLRRYYEKLRQAGSPYAFYTIGSAFAVRADAYVKAGGMRVRAGGEDFYFLQAVAKVGNIRQLDEVLVAPSARVSDRVPFGTGPAVNNLIHGGKLPEIGDESFALLKQILTAANPEALADTETFLGTLPSTGRTFFTAEGFPGVWPKILGNLPKRPGANVAAFHLWFDGLKTLRFLHFADRGQNG